MKITHFDIAKYSIGHKFTYTLYALGDDGVLYKGAFNGSKHCGWIPMSSEKLPPEWEVTTWEARLRRQAHNPNNKPTRPLPVDEADITPK